MRTVFILHSVAAATVLLAISMISPIFAGPIHHFVEMVPIAWGNFLEQMGNSLIAVIKSATPSSFEEFVLVATFSLIAFLIIRLLKPIYRESLESKGLSLQHRC